MSRTSLLKRPVLLMAVLAALGCLAAGVRLVGAHEPAAAQPRPAGEAASRHGNAPGHHPDHEHQGDRDHGAHENDDHDGHNDGTPEHSHDDHDGHNDGTPEDSHDDHDGHNDAKPEHHHDDHGHGHEEGIVPLSADQIGAAGIDLVRASRGSHAAEVIAQGNVVPTPEGAAIISARTDGVVVGILKRIGDPVTAEEPLAYIESREAAAFAADLASAQAREQAARAALTREKRLFEANITARQDYEAAEAEHASAAAELGRAQAFARSAGVSPDGRTISVASPIAGQIMAAPVTLGAYVSTGTELFRVSDQKDVQVEAAVPATEALRVAPGNRAAIEAAGGTVEASVRAITPGLDPESRSVTVLLVTEHNDHGLRPGQFVRARIFPSSHNSGDRIVIPDEAVQTIDGQSAVFVRNEEGFEMKPVVTGRREAGRVEILRGLAPGALVAGKNAFLIKAELQKSEASHEH